MNSTLSPDHTAAARAHMRSAWAPIVTFTDAQWNALQDVFEPRILLEGSYHALPGDKLYELLFVHQGLLRFFYVDERGDENNKVFIHEGEFGGSLGANGPGISIDYGVQALEDSLLLLVDLGAFRALYAQDPAFEHLGRELAERQLRRKELLARNMLQLSATERYERLRTEHPWVLQRVPQYHIASHLGITEVSLSRIRRTSLKT